MALGVGARRARGDVPECLARVRRPGRRSGTSRSVVALGGTEPLEFAVEDVQDVASRIVPSPGPGESPCEVRSKAANVTGIGIVVAVAQARTEEQIVDRRTGWGAHVGVEEYVGAAALPDDVLVDDGADAAEQVTAQGRNVAVGDEQQFGRTESCEALGREDASDSLAAHPREHQDVRLAGCEDLESFAVPDLHVRLEAPDVASSAFDRCGRSVGADGPSDPPREGRADRQMGVVAPDVGESAFDGDPREHGAQPRAEPGAVGRGRRDHGVHATRSTTMRDVAESKALLEATHAFPGSYVFKAFGPAGDAFESGVVAAAATVVERERIRVARRESGSGRKVCVTLDVDVASADEVLAIYAALRTVDALVLLL
ncbi:MAG: DUF493 family protein [Deltaproteobacteria bacterium]|nr:MAG: DUF493 family protein [Deltaproteobacteria bacterium]